MEMAALLLLVSAVAAFRTLPSIPNINEHLTLSRLHTAYNPLPLSELKVTDKVINLRRAESYYSLSSMYYQALRRQAAELALTGGGRPTNGSAILTSAEAGQVFLAPVTVGGQDFEVVIDSGSSDPWLVQTNFTCADFYGDDLNESDCYFGTLYDPSSSTTYTAIPNENFNISYADGEHLTGTMGYESFTMGGVTVPHQNFGLVDYAAWSGDGISSGLVGFAYRTLTSAYGGSNPSDDVPGTTLMYNPLFVDMYTNRGVPPVFSLAIDRDPDNGGILALGGIPNIPHSPVFVSTPILPVGVNASNGQEVYEFYTIVTDGFAVSGSESTQFNPYENSNSMKMTLMANQTQAIVDSGTSLFYAPDDVAQAVANLFDPPAVWDPDQQEWFVECNASAPVFGVGVSCKAFYVNPADMIVPTSPTQCISGIQPNFGGLTILGDVWMKNVIAVFDIGAEHMRFAARQYYGLTPQTKKANT